MGLNLGFGVRVQHLLVAPRSPRKVKDPGLGKISRAAHMLGSISVSLESSSVGFNCRI